MRLKLREVPEKIEQSAGVVGRAVNTNTVVVAVVGTVAVVALLVALVALKESR